MVDCANAFSREMETLFPVKTSCLDLLLMLARARGRARWRVRIGCHRQDRMASPGVFLPFPVPFSQTQKSDQP